MGGMAQATDDLAGPLARPSAVPALLTLGVVAVSFAAVLIRSASAPALALAFWRSAGGAVALLPFAARAGVRPDARGRRALVAGGACLAVHFALFTGAFAFTSVASVVVFAAMGPLFVGLGAWLVLDEAPSRRTWAGIGVAVLGAAVVAAGDVGSGSGSNPLLGDAMALASAVAVAGYLLVGQGARGTLPVSTYGVWVYGTAALLLAGAALLLGSPLAGFDAGTWLAIAGLVAGPQLLGHTTFNLLLSVVPATTIAVIVLAEPVGAGLLAFLLLGEVPPPLLAVGGPLILGGVVLAVTGARPVEPVEPTAG
jgi:drug/metabolite transporter (DMT)-like permease